MATLSQFPGSLLGINPTSLHSAGPKVVAATFGSRTDSASLLCLLSRSSLEANFYEVEK